MKNNKSKIIKKIIRNNTFINIKITNDNYIKMINNKFRKKNKITDILTFKNEKSNRIGGEIYICKKILKKYKKNIKKIINHGILHILNYNHEKKKDYKIMKKLETIIGMSGIEPPTITTSK